MSAIAGVRIVPLRRIADERGAVSLMLKATDPYFAGFAEIYFSSVYPGVVKAWKNHQRMTVHYACVHGRVKLVLWDDREESPTRGALVREFLGPDEHKLVVIPPRIWHGFQGLGEPVSILANCATEVSDPDELDRLEPRSSRIPYNWDAPDQPARAATGEPT
jgi:dTDP-4-dehydrorhamnose 3,5-epimerase